MNEIVVLAGLSLFFIGPAIGFFMVLNDQKNAIIIRNETTRITKDLERIYRSTRSNSILTIYGELSNYLEETIQNIEISWLKTSLRFLIELNAIGFREETVSELLNNGSYRNNVLRNTRSILFAMNEKNVLNLMMKTANTIGLLMCDPNSNHKVFLYDKDDAIDFAKDTLYDIHKYLLYEFPDMIIIENQIKTTITYLSNNCDFKSVGLALLILKWAQLELRSIRASIYQHNKNYSRVLKNLSKKFFEVAKYLNNRNYYAISRVIYFEGS